MAEETMRYDYETRTTLNRPRMFAEDKGKDDGLKGRYNVTFPEPTTDKGKHMRDLDAASYGAVRMAKDVGIFEVEPGVFKTEAELTRDEFKQMLGKTHTYDYDRLAPSFFEARESSREGGAGSVEDEFLQAAAQIRAVKKNAGASPEDVKKWTGSVVRKIYGDNEHALHKGVAKIVNKIKKDLENAADIGDL